MIGRDKELRTLRRLLADAAAGHGSAMLIHGAAGVGKSALLRTVGAEAIESGFKVLRTSGVEPEQWLPFAALQMLLQPVAHGMKDLSAPHRSALSGAFGVRDTEPEIYRVGLAVLELLADEANQQPLLLLVDDLQWIDSSSRDVLKFVARRTNDLAIQVIAAARIQYSESYVLLDIPLQPLSRPAAAELLDVGAPDLLASLRALILERAAGNPLALVELPKAVQGVTAQMDDLPLTQRLEDAFSARSDSVSRECRTLLLVLAAEPSAPLNLLLELSSRISGSAVSVDAVQEAVDADLVTLVGYTAEFRHPLMRTAIYTHATLADRLATHRALASVMDDTPERQLAHEAAATIGPDEELAARLERFADVSQARGKAAAAVPALRQAADLVLDAQRRTGILVRAAELSSEINHRISVQMLLNRTDMSGLGRVERARLMVVSDSSAFEPGEPQRRIQEMVTAAAGAFDAGAGDVAENLLWRASARCFFQDGEAQVRAQAAAELDRWNPDPNAPHVLAVRAYTEPFRHGADVIARLGGIRADHQDGRMLHFLGSGAMVIGDISRATQYLALATAAWRSQGRLGLLARSLAASWPQVYLGQLERAREESAEGLALAEETGEWIVWLGLKATAGLVAALRGETEQAARMIGELRLHSLFLGMPFVTVMAQQTDGLLALFDGRAMEAYDVLARAFDPVDPHYHSVSRWLLAPDLADAAVAAGTVKQARELLADLPDLTRRLPSEMMVVAHAYTDAVLAPDDTAEERYAAALAALPADWTLSRARLHLHHGRWLRRQRRNVDARHPLRLARTEFDRVGAQPWAEMAREQLRATGESNGRRHANTGEQLSAQEMQIALLASQGLSNREIGQRLFISHRTVGAHLYRIYPRLGITGRGKLAAALAALHDEQPTSDVSSAPE
ncbi:MULTISPECIES: AAA family ATPase [Streptomyces]|uniref:AAA family ATPase n=1 Tax=Streptomyces mirabilis TaxID=68239 RepID=A0ABU3UHP8_9ACTN|nr:MULTISPECIES: LuxR family transcriptional regulator [Streptomyces]MDU8993451.1 AAA family ATPase [Streptomyces mirabilis]QDN91045.1 AAA family ATPase [Streptomyces sp. RLB3-6]QDO11869.1 AAA family ATPase [Streptomyces sp. S1D4-23]